MGNITVNVDPVALTRDLQYQTNPVGVTLSIDPFELVVGPLTYNVDGLATQHNCDFMNDPKFQHAYQLGKSTGSWGQSEIPWRLHVILWAAEQALRLEGDFVECGVNRGGLSYSIINYFNFERTGKNFWLLDTFNGLVEEYVSEEEKSRNIHNHHIYQECYDAVKQTFSPYPQVKIIRGMVPDTLPQVTAEKVAYLSIDMNCVMPEIAAAEYFWEKMVSGGMIVLDDYGWALHIAQKEAFDVFTRERNVSILALPTGQAIIMKP